MGNITKAILEHIACFPEEQHFAALKTAMILALDHGGPGDGPTFAEAADQVNQCGTLDAFLEGENDGIKGTCTSPKLVRSAL